MRCVAPSVPSWHTRGADRCSASTTPVSSPNTGTHLATDRPCSLAIAGNIRPAVTSRAASTPTCPNQIADSAADGPAAARCAPSHDIAVSTSSRTDDTSSGGDAVDLQREARQLPIGADRRRLGELVTDAAVQPTGGCRTPPVPAPDVQAVALPGRLADVGRGGHGHVS